MENKDTTEKFIYRTNQILVGIWVVIILIFFLGADSQNIYFFWAMLISYISSFVLLVFSCVFAVSGLLRARKINRLNNPLMLGFERKLRVVSIALLVCSVGFFAITNLFKNNIY